MILNPRQVKGLLRIHFQDTIESCSSSELEQSIQLQSTDLWPPPPPPKTSCGDADSASDFRIAAVIYSVLCGKCNLIVKSSKNKIFDERDKQKRDLVTASCGRFDWKMSSGPVFQKHLQAMKIMKSRLRNLLKLKRPFVSPPTHWQLRTPWNALNLERSRHVSLFSS